MSSSLLLRLIGVMSLLAFSAEAQATVQVSFSGTTATSSTLVAPGLPVTGSFSFDQTPATLEYSGTNVGGDFAAYQVPGSAQFTVEGQTFNYNLVDIELTTAGVILFQFAGTSDPANTMFIFDQTANANISGVPDASALSSFLFLTASFPVVGAPTGLINVDIPLGVPEPGTWAMMLLGFASVGLEMRRRRGAPVHIRWGSAEDQPG